MKLSEFRNFLSNTVVILGFVFIFTIVVYCFFINPKIDDIKDITTLFYS